MEDRKKIFYENLIVEDGDKERVKRYLKAKGIEKHILIKEKLKSWTLGDIEYTQVASTYRYDKRIRLCLFKYISYLEEFYRSVILDAYFCNVDQNFFIKRLVTQIKGNGNDLNKALERLEFSDLLKQIRKLPDDKQELCGVKDKKHTSKNFTALKELRNAVMHNKFLLLYYGFEVCFYDEEKSSTLKANILNLIQYLPADVGNQCKKDINDCKENRNTEKDTKWDLPSQVIIEF